MGKTQEWIYCCEVPHMLETNSENELDLLSPNRHRNVRRLPCAGHCLPEPARGWPRITECLCLCVYCVCVLTGIELWIYWNHIQDIIFSFLPFSKGDTRVILVFATDICGILVFAADNCGILMYAADICGILSMPQSFECFQNKNASNDWGIRIRLGHTEYTWYTTNICGNHKYAANICGIHEYDSFISLWEWEEWKNNVLF